MSKDEYQRVADDEWSFKIWLDEAGRKALRHLHLNGACRDGPVEMFFPGRGGDSKSPSHMASRARLVCGGCPVQGECLTFALETLEREGIWGGTNEKERRPLLRRMQAGEPADVIAAGFVEESRERRRTA